jgi:hypothetical protein
MKFVSFSRATCLIEKTGFARASVLTFEQRELRRGRLPSNRPMPIFMRFRYRFRGDLQRRWVVTKVFDEVRDAEEAACLNVVEQ